MPTPSPHRWFALLLFVLPFSVACTATARPFRLRPPHPGIEHRGPAGDGQEPEPTIGPIEPDRPDVTNGTHIVDEGLLQVEVGGQYARGPALRSVGTPLTVRIGLLEWLEVRAGTDGFLQQTDEASTVAGMGNVQLAAKVRLFADPGGIPVLSILPTINLPLANASKGLGSGDVDVTLAVLTGTDVGRSTHVDVNYGIGAIGAGEGRPHFTQHLVSVSVSHALTEQFSPYVEGYWFSKQDPDGKRVVSIDGGAIHAFSPRLAADAGVSIGLSSSAPDLSVFAGLSVIVGDVLGDHGVIARQRKAARLRRTLAR